MKFQKSNLASHLSHRNACNQDQDFGSAIFVIDCLIIFTFEVLDDLIYSGSELEQKSIHISLKKRDLLMLMFTI